jgi:hypothetical protein
MDVDVACDRLEPPEDVSGEHRLVLAGRARQNDEKLAVEIGEHSDS